MDAIADVVPDELVLDLVIRRFAPDPPQQERADWIIAENGIKEADYLICVPDEFPLYCREKMESLRSSTASRILIDLLVIVT